MHSENKFLNQWHETHKIEENGISFFLKKYEPNSYEIKNELNWLLSKMIQTCHSFGVPRVHDHSVEKGFIKMDFIEQNSAIKPNKEIIDFLATSAAELHSLIKSENPKLRNSVSKTEYNSFLKKYTEKRIDSLKNTEFELPEDIVVWILNQIDKLRVNFFSIVHRDMRARHLLFQKDSEKPILIDWEFSNISDPAQDLAKIIYDGTTHNLNRQEITKQILNIYTSNRNVSNDEITEHIYTFLPIIPLERSMSLINRKPKGYEKEILNDLCFIKAIYEEKK